MRNAVQVTRTVTSRLLMTLEDPTACLRSTIPVSNVCPYTPSADIHVPNVACHTEILSGYSLRPKMNTSTRCSLTIYSCDVSILIGMRQRHEGRHSFPFERLLCQAL